MKMLMLGVQIAAEQVGIWQSLVQQGSWDVGLTVRLYESTNHFFFRYPSKIHNAGMNKSVGVQCTTFTKRTRKDFQWICRGSLGGIDLY